MSLFVVDVEADGNIISEHSMVCFGAVLVKDMTKTFYGQTAPISSMYEPDTLAVSGFSRDEHEKFQHPSKTMPEFAEWVMEVNEPGTRIQIYTDNPAFDFPWINYYLLKYVGVNVFGWSARRIGDLYCGLVGDVFAKWKHLRITPATHHPVDDAKGNAEVIHHMKDKMGLKIKL